MRRLTKQKKQARPVPKPAQLRHFIREWRLYRDLTQERLAARVGLSTSSISQIENYKQGYTDETLAALAVALDCEPGDLLKHDPLAPDYQLWAIIKAYPRDQQQRALDILRAAFPAA